MKRRRPDAESDRSRACRDGERCGERDRERGPRPERDDVLPLCARGREHALAQRLGRGRPLGREREGGCRVSKSGEVIATAVAVVEMCLVTRAVFGVEGVERVGGGKLVKVVGHTNPKPYSRCEPERFDLPE